MRHPVADLIFKELDHLQHENWPPEEKIKILYQLLQLVFQEETTREKLYFSTFFARMAYVGVKCQLDRRSLFFLHYFRRRGKLVSDGQAVTDAAPALILEAGYYAVLVALEKVLLLKVPEQYAALYHAPHIPEVTVEVKRRHASLRFLAVENVATESCLRGFTEENPAVPVQVYYNQEGRNDNFAENINRLVRHELFPLTMNLVDVEEDKQGKLYPGMIVYEPDYLMDITAIAECFKSSGFEHLPYVLKKFIDKPQNKSLLQGHIANFFLDEIAVNKNAEFKETFRKAFTLNPLAFALLSDEEIKELMTQSRTHFTVLREVLHEHLVTLDIDLKHIYLEPSFFSPAYGIQGRLDLFHLRMPHRTDVIELKSGKLYQANSYGLNVNHYIQTILYDLLVRSIYQARRSNSYILYSGQPEKPLRYAPVIHTQQKEAMQLRNDLIIFEKILTRLQPTKRSYFDQLDADQYPHLQGFGRHDLDQFILVYQGLDSVEKSLFKHYIRFIATEQHLAKTGVEGSDQNHGLAALWLNTAEEKLERYEMLSALKLTELTWREGTPTLTLERDALHDTLTNFRVGDIAVLYATLPQATLISPLDNQIFKCTLIGLNETTVIVRLRNKQVQGAIFQEAAFWNLEKDVLDSSFTQMYQGLLQFSQAPVPVRELLLGRRPPDPPVSALPHADFAYLTSEQAALLTQIISAREYFLLWGPPGTGKTSTMIRALVQHYLSASTDQLLLLAYTNRAVDEICEALELLESTFAAAYLRIGSRYSTAPAFRHRLLDVQIEQIATRRELLDLLAAHRIIVATVSSLNSRSEIFQLKSFQMAIVDEASQLLDPNLLGLLSRIPKWVLIGDHQQLPAVVAQRPHHSQVEDEQLRALGFHNLRDSFFERLYRRAQEQRWTWACGQLSQQGRMHQDIMAFPNQMFYQGSLRVLDKLPSLYQALTAPPHYQLGTQAGDLEKTLAQHRLVFIPTGIDLQDHHKTNRFEAEVATLVIRAFQALASANDGHPSLQSLGVITPYRAQIAMIRQHLAAQGLLTPDLTIDTVERYQGGAKDIIIISLCTNHLRQLEQLVSMSEEGVDRKLNVALTRARYHLVILGNVDILRQNTVYAQLMESCYTLRINEEL